MYKRRILLSALLLSGAFAAPMATAADVKSLAGSYSFVSVTQTSPSGEKTEPFGPKPVGMTLFGADGRYVSTVMKPGLPKFAANTRNKATPEEMKAVVEGNISHYGKYTIEGDMINFHIEHASFPNWDGTTQKRKFKIEGDVLKYHVPAASAGGTAEVVLRRVK
jgi:hypothetical protein